MHIPHILTRLARFLFQRSTKPPISAHVLDVSDGDTITVLLNGAKQSVRLFGLDTPETAKPWRKTPGQPLGEEARAFLRQHLQKNQPVFLKPQATDRYGRTVALVFTDPETPSVNERILSKGLAWYDEYGHRLSPDHPEREPLKSAFLAAQNARVGLWSLASPEPPHQFRKRHSF